MSLIYLEDKWDSKLARSLDEADTLRYRSNRTTGHVIPVDGGLKEAFLR